MKNNLKKQEWYFFKEEKGNQYTLSKFIPSPESNETNLQKPNKDEKDYKEKYLAAYVYFFCKIERPNKISHSCSTPLFEL